MALDVPAPAGEQSNPYVPKGPTDPLICEAFEGINTATTRPGVDDKELYWADSFMPLGPKRNLRTMYGISAALYTSTNNIAFFGFANIGTTPYAIVIQNDGSISAVNTNTGLASQIAAAGTISSPSQINAAISQWGSQYIQIVAKQTNGYFIWDGTTFYVPGGAGPGDDTQMPTAIGGTCIENYAGRVWIGNGATVTFSAPGSVIDFSSGNGGGNFSSTDSFLRSRFIALKQTNGFLYSIGDSSINYISGVQTSGSPPVTTFTNQNADPETGTAWPGTVVVFNRNILFANPFGAQVSYGGAVTKTSEKLDGVYNTVNFGSFVPSAAKAIIFGKKCWILLLPIIDPFSGQQVNKLFLWNQKIWWPASQEVPLIFITFQEIDSVLTAWGTDGSSIYQLFAQPSTSLEKVFQSKLWDTPGGYQMTKFINRFWALVQYYNTSDSEIDVTLDNESGSTSLQAQLSPAVSTWFTNADVASSWLTSGSVVSSWLTGGPSQFSVSLPDSTGTNGVLNGFTVTTNCADVAVISMMVQPDIAGYRG